jgi:hypothetical protein
MKVTINNPNPYNSKNTGTAMVSYVVTGDKASVEQYRQDQLANGISSQDDNGNPLIHFTAKASLKYGAVSELERATAKDGNIIWFTDNAEDKQMDLLVAGADEATKAAYAQIKLAEMRDFARTLANNRAKNIAKLQGKTVAAEAIDNL